MKKEIVIASYSEDSDWIKGEWSEHVTHYCCGNPTTTANERFVSEDFMRASKKVPNPFNNFSHGHQEHGPVTELMKLLELIKKMKSVLKDFDSEDPDTYDADQVYSKVNNKNNTYSLESHQWLTHIIRRYDTLADVTVFLQGHPHDHYIDFKDVFEKDFKEGFSFSCLPYVREAKKLTRLSHFDDATIAFWSKMKPYMPQKWDRSTAWAVGAQFAASKEVIRSKPREWYIKVKEMASDHEFSAHALERTWWVVLGKPKITHPY